MLAIILIILGIGLDQLTKYLVVHNIKNSGSLTIIKNVLRITYVENRGAAFGILQEQMWFFILITVVTLSVLFYMLIRNYKHMSLWVIISLSMVIGGTIGNFIDRWRLGYVVDFISLRFFNRYDFAVFNVADMLIVVGGIMIMIAILVHDLNYDKSIKRHQ